MEDIFSSPFLQALKTEHAGIAIGSGLALRYPADVIPFGGLAEASSEAMTALGDLLQPDEVIYVTGDQIPQSKNIVHVSELQRWQMHFKNQNDIDSPTDRLDEIQIKSLEGSDAPSMVALTNVAFPGYFRPRTYVCWARITAYTSTENSSQWPENESCSPVLARSVPSVPILPIPGRDTPRP
jgi:hypothetical protein